MSKGYPCGSYARRGESEAIVAEAAGAGRSKTGSPKVERGKVLCDLTSIVHYHSGIREEHNALVGPQAIPWPLS